MGQENRLTDGTEIAWKAVEYDGYIHYTLYKIKASVTPNLVVIDVKTKQKVSPSGIYIWYRSTWLKSEYNPKNLIVAQMWVEQLVISGIDEKIEIVPAEGKGFHTANFRVKI